MNIFPFGLNVFCANEKSLSEKSLLYKLSMISQALKQSETRRETDLLMFYARYVKSKFRFRLFTKFSDIAAILRFDFARCTLQFGTIEWLDDATPHVDQML